MLEAVYIDLPRREIVGVTPRGALRRAFTALSQRGSGLKLMPPEGANWVTGPYRVEIVEDVHQPVLQAEPELMTGLLLEHLAEHVRAPE